MLRQIQIRVAAFTGGERVPSARFRVRQYIPHLKEEGIHVSEYFPSSGAYPPPRRFLRPFWVAASLSERVPGILRSRTSDVTLIQREFLSTFSTFERYTNSPRVFDVDDAIWIYRCGKAAKRLASISDRIICGNRFLADWFANWNSAITILPTAVDTKRFCPAPSRNGEKVVIGWTGGSRAFKELQSIETSLATILRKFPNARLRIMADKEVHLPSLAGQIDFVQWSQDVEVARIQEFDIGLMPLEDTDWNRGKCSYKMLLYMSCGVVPIVSPFGMNLDVARLGDVALQARNLKEWSDCLEFLILNQSKRRKMARAGREIVVGHFSTDVIVPRLADSLRSVIS